MEKVRILAVVELIRLCGLMCLEKNNNGARPPTTSHNLIPKPYSWRQAKENVYVNICKKEDRKVTKTLFVQYSIVCFCIRPIRYVGRTLVGIETAEQFFVHLWRKAACCSITDPPPDRPRLVPPYQRNAPLLLSNAMHSHTAELFPHIVKKR